MKRNMSLLAAAGALLSFGLAGDTHAQVPVSNRCFTPQFWCFMPQLAPVGTPCFCGTPYGMARGIVR